MILEGIRVVDMTQWAAGPGAAAMLADLGAEVIHVEEPEKGDPQRLMKGWHRGSDFILPGGNHRLHFELVNRNKKSLAIDLKKQDGKDIVYQLVEKADVFVTNYRQGVLTKLGMEYETLSRFNPKLIYACGLAFGRKGPMAGRGAFDIMGQAMSGMMYTGDHPDAPVQLNVGIVDSLASVFLAYGIIAALLGRERLGIGQQVESSLLGAAIFSQHLPVTFSLFSGQEYQENRRTSSRPLYNYYKCKDGRWLALASNFPQYWGDLCEALGVKELQEDPSFIDQETRDKNSEELIAILDRVFVTKTYEEWERIFEKKDIIFCPVLKTTELASNPQILANEYIIDFDHPFTGQRLKMPGQPIKYSKTSASTITAAPMHGQHTEEVLREVLGYTSERISELMKMRVVRQYVDQKE
jgi:crotonobetainyl-CoA:carnitine CoA-transferase CaiB-like acyl-CoA transferase